MSDIKIPKIFGAGYGMGAWAQNIFEQWIKENSKVVCSDFSDELETIWVPEERKGKCPTHKALLILVQEIQKQTVICRECGREK